MLQVHEYQDSAHSYQGQNDNPQADRPIPKHLILDLLLHHQTVYLAIDLRHLVRTLQLVYFPEFLHIEQGVLHVRIRLIIIESLIPFTLGFGYPRQKAVILRLHVPIVARRGNGIRQAHIMQGRIRIPPFQKQPSQVRIAQCLDLGIPRGFLQSLMPIKESRIVILFLEKQGRLVVLDPAQIHIAATAAQGFGIIEIGQCRVQAAVSQIDRTDIAGQYNLVRAVPAGSQCL